MPPITKFQRRRIASHAIYGVVVARSRLFTLIQRIDDFRCDGYVILRNRDITAASVHPSEKTHAAIIRAEGRWQAVSSFAKRMDISSLAAILAHLRKTVVIIEDERPKSKNFFIGRIIHLAPSMIGFRHFDADAIWQDPCFIRHRSMTQIRFDDDYSRIYAKHLPPMPKGLQKVAAKHAREVRRGRRPAPRRRS
jgi:hypothetical protein